MNGHPLKRRLLTPGPVELHPRALEALAGPQIHHRSTEAKERFLHARMLLGEAFRTEGEVLILTGSGTAGMEALVLNLFAPGERVYVPVLGKFSGRWAEIAGSAGLDVVKEDFRWGSTLSVEALEQALDRHDVSGVLLTHCETSTGVLADLESLAGAVKACRPEVMVVVDAVSSLLVAPFAMEDWGVDAAVSGSQKGVMCPPGLAFAALSPRALDRLRPRGYYLNLGRERKGQSNGASAYTPAINLVLAVEAVLEQVLPVREAHLDLKVRQSELLYEAGDGYGLRPVPERRSPALAAFWVPEGMSEPSIREAFRARGAVIAGGQGPLAGRIFRLSMMGHSDLDDAGSVAGILGDVIRELSGRVGV